MAMWDAVKAWFKTEASEVKDAADGLESRLESELGRRERQLDETPQDAMARIQEEIEENSALDAVADRIDHKAAKADAVADLADLADGSEDSEDSEDSGATEAAAVQGDEELGETDPDELDR